MSEHFKFYVAFYRRHVDTNEPLTDHLHVITFDDNERYRGKLAEVQAASHLLVVGFGLTSHHGEN